MLTNTVLYGGHVCVLTDTVLYGGHVCVLTDIVFYGGHVCVLTDIVFYGGRVRMVFEGLEKRISFPPKLLKSGKTEWGL